MMKAMIVRNNDTQEALAHALNLPQSAISNRINGKVDFRISEIQCIRKRYRLTAEALESIFFDGPVSSADTFKG